MISAKPRRTTARRRRRRLPLGPAILLLLAGCRGEPAAEPGAPLRLLDLAAAAERQWPAAPPARPGWGIEPAAEDGADPVVRVTMLGASPRDDGVRRHPWGLDARLALAAPGESRTRFRLRLPDSPTLEVGLGWVPRERETTIEFEVAVEPAAASRQRQVVLARRLRTLPEGDWLEVSVPLEPWAGQAVTLELATRPAPGAEPAWAAWSSPEVRSLSRDEPGFDVILISLDTLRADHLGCYGYERPTSPSLDALARRSVRFATAVSQAPWTRPAHRSMLNGVYPVSHGGRAAPPLPRRLRQAGYRTWALTSGGQVHPQFGFAAGFDSYRVANWLEDVDALAGRLAAQRGRRDFVFLHTYEIHDPFTHDEFARELPRDSVGASYSHADHQRLRRRLSEADKAYVRALYDGDIAYTDRQLGRLLDELGRRGLIEHTVIVVTSDHGEQFWEHGGFRHGQSVYDHQLLVPLILHVPEALARRLDGAPELAGRVVKSQVRLVDIYPTVLDLLGLPLEAAIHGRSLVPLLGGEPAAPAPPPAFAENTSSRLEWKALRASRYKLMRSYPAGGQPGQARLFDLEIDPGERHDRSGELPDVLAALETALAEIVAGGGAGERAEDVPAAASEELREQLRALGYVGE